MNALKHWLRKESRTVAVLIGLAVGLGLAVHEAFFVLALMIVLVVVGEWTAERAHVYLRELHLQRQHP